MAAPTEWDRCSWQSDSHCYRFDPCCALLKMKTNSEMIAHKYRVRKLGFLCWIGLLLIPMLLLGVAISDKHLFLSTLCLLSSCLGIALFIVGSIKSTACEHCRRVVDTCAVQCPHCNVRLYGWLDHKTENILQSKGLNKWKTKIKNKLEKTGEK